MTGLIIRKMITRKHFIEFETPYYANYNPIFITCKFDFGRKFNIRPVTFSQISRKIHVCICSGGAARGAGGAIAPPAFRNCHVKMQ